MEYSKLNNGVEMPLAGLGTWDLNGAQCTEAVKAALDMGYRLIDTAQMYGNEAEVGRAIRESGVAREEVFLTTKIYRPSSSYEKAKAAIDRSLKTLGLDYVDLLLLHEPYQYGPEMYRAMEEAYRAGKARAIGISNYDERWYDSFLTRCEIIPAVNQLECHVYYQKWALQQRMLARGTVLQAWAPLAQGLGGLTDHAVLREIGSKYEKTAAQVALRFLVQRGISVVPKSKRPERLRENLALFSFALTDDEMERIKALDRNDTLFPWTTAF